MTRDAPSECRARKIIHIDMDAFYAAVEQRDNPAWRGVPVIVGGTPDGRGVVATASYEARRFGIHSAMPAAHARRLCPEAIFVRPRFDVYRQVSRQIQALLHEITDQIEPLALDEAYLDVTDCTAFANSATRIAQHLRERIHSTLALTASAGISYNKFLAKLASDMNKPNGQHVILPEHGPSFVETLPVGRFHGIGAATEARLHALGIYTGADLKARGRDALREAFGKLGPYYHDLAHGMDRRPVSAHRERKSLGAETTYPHDLRGHTTLLDELERIAHEVCISLERRALCASTVTIKIKFADFRQITRSQALSRPLLGPSPLRPLLDELLVRSDGAEHSVRLLGVTLSGLADAAASSGQNELPLDE